MTAFNAAWHWVVNWGPVVALAIAAWTGAAILLALAYHNLKALYMRRHGIRVGAPRDRVAEVLTLHEQREQTIRDAIRAEAERLYPGMPHLGMRDGMVWPDDLCSAPTCSPEDGGVCDHHQRLAKPLAERVGKHRAVWSVPLDDQPGEVIQAVVTDLKERGPQ